MHLIKLKIYWGEWRATFFFFYQVQAVKYAVFKTQNCAISCKCRGNILILSFTALRVRGAYGQGIRHCVCVRAKG